MQALNIRIGKHGGLFASCLIRDKAEKAGLHIVGGSMVGETAIMRQASTVFLHRSCVEYIEGLEENAGWLNADPVTQSQGDPSLVSDVIINERDFEKCLVRKVVNKF